MSKDNLTIQDIEVMKARGWTPNYYLTNMSMAEFEDSEFASRCIFPICPVQVSSGKYYSLVRQTLHATTYKESLSSAKSHRQ